MHSFLDVNNSSAANFLHCKNIKMNWKKQLDGLCYGAEHVR